jgi:hypothetical protein
MSRRNKHGTWPWVYKVIAMARYFIREGRLGLVSVVFLSLWPLGKEISDLFHFPPQERPFAKFLIVAMAFAVWGLTRAWIHRNTPDELLEQTERVTIATREATLQIETHQKTDRELSEQKVYRNWWRCSLLFFPVSILLFAIYFALSASWVSTSKEKGVNLSLETQRVFFHPFQPTSEYSKALALRGGYEFVVDNDADWLDDVLQKEGWQVTITKLILLTCVLLATAAFVFSTTLISSLSKHVVTEDDAIGP